MDILIITLWFVALSSTDFVTDWAASYMVSVDYIYQMEFSLMYEF